jgi:hypothetical protein
VPQQLLGGGQHFNNTTGVQRQRHAENAARALGTAAGGKLSCKILHWLVAQKDLRCPPSRGWDTG